ncbi:MAG: hypothetical protein KIT09_13230 [Bryobacteraceae bacterium]|nr:hypothetical protein [Bryobacteraceae bacterium]
MTLGADPKRIAILAGLGLVAGYLIYSNLGGDEGPPATRRATAPQTRPVARPTPGDAAAAARARTLARAGREFRPSLKPRRPEDQLDPMKVDPTLRLDLLAKLRTVEANGVRRSLFDFGAAPPPEPEPKIVPKEVAQTHAEPESSNGPEEPAKPVKPPPPPINLKFYGFISPADAPVRRAFFLDGDEIFVAAEGDLIRKRYKVVRIGINSAVVEDTEHQHQQTIALVEHKG